MEETGERGSVYLLNFVVLGGVHAVAASSVIIFIAQLEKEEREEKRERRARGVSVNY